MKLYEERINMSTLNVELLTDEEMSKIFKVDKATIVTWVHRKKIPDEAIFKLPFTKKGTRRFIKSKIEDWINGGLQTQE
jgi:transposase